MISDPASFFEQVIHQTLSHLNRDDSRPVDPGKPSDESTLIELLGARLAAMFQPDPSQPPDRGADGDSDLSPVERAHYQELLERNATLAFALGACDCWGEHSDCNICWGDGKPGWALPDPYFFSQLVRPALQAIKETSAGRPQGARTRPRAPRNER